MPSLMCFGCTNLLLAWHVPCYKLESFFCLWMFVRVLIGPLFGYNP